MGREGEIRGTAVVYARFSCSKQREASIDDQLRVCREWCAREIERRTCLRPAFNAPTCSRTNSFILPIGRREDRSDGIPPA